MKAEGWKFTGYMWCWMLQRWMLELCALPCGWGSEMRHGAVVPHFAMSHLWFWQWHADTAFVRSWRKYTVAAHMSRSEMGFFMWNHRLVLQKAEVFLKSLLMEKEENTFFGCPKNLLGKTTAFVCAAHANFNLMECIISWKALKWEPQKSVTSGQLSSFG